MREIAHAQKRNPLSDVDELLHDGRYPRRNHVGKFWWRSVKGFRCGGGSNFGLSHWLWSSSLQHSRTTVRVCEPWHVINAACGIGYYPHTDYVLYFSGLAVKGLRITGSIAAGCKHTVGNRESRHKYRGRPIPAHSWPSVDTKIMTKFSETMKTGKTYSLAAVLLTYVLIISFWRSPVLCSFDRGNSMYEQIFPPLYNL